MNDKPHEHQDDRLAQIEDVLKQHHLDWPTLAGLAKQRNREALRNRKRILRMLTSVRETLPEIKDYLTVAYLAEVQSSVEEIASVIEGLAGDLEKSLPPAGPPVSLT